MNGRLHLKGFHQNSQASLQNYKRMFVAVNEFNIWEKPDLLLIHTIFWIVIDAAEGLLNCDAHCTAFFLNTAFENFRV